MKYKITLIIFHVSIFLNCNAQKSYITVTCTDVQTGTMLGKQQISKGTVYLMRSNGTKEDFGPVIDGKFEIESACNRGDKYTIVIDQGSYFSDTYYCIQIKNFKNKFPLRSQASLAQLKKNLNSIQNIDFNNSEAKYASMAYLSSSIAYFQLKNSNIEEYKLKSKETYQYLGEALNVKEPIYYDPSQDLWVPSNKLVQEVIKFKEQNSFNDINGQIDYNFLKSLTGLNPSSKYLDPNDLYKKVEKNFENR